MIANTERFTGRVDTYDRYRMRYPAAEIISTMSQWCKHVPGHTVADIGAGSGMLSEVFLANHNIVFAVEPNAEMRAAAAPLLERYKKFTIIDAPAEATTLRSKSVHLVTAGRAFHWFDRERAMAEFARILKPGGWIALFSASRARNNTPQSRDLEAILNTYSKDRSHTGGGHHIHENPQDIFPGDEIHQRRIDDEENLDLEAFIGQSLSYSSAPLPTDPQYNAFLHDLQGIFDRYASNGILRIATTCWITCGRP